MLPQSLGLQSAINGHLEAINCTLNKFSLDCLHCQAGEPHQYALALHLPLANRVRGLVRTRFAPAPDLALSHARQCCR